MAIPRLLLSHLCRPRPLCRARVSHLLLLNPNPPLFPLQSSILSSSDQNPNPSFLDSLPVFRSVSTRSGAADRSDIGSSDAEPELFDIGFNQVISEAAADVASVGGGGYGEGILPVRALISLIDGYHDLTGLPWWIVIASCTVAMRITLLPLYILQLRKLRRISELIPKLPPPFPPPLSGKSFLEQYSLFRKQRQAIGCPSYLWQFAYLSAQIPCFLLWMSSIRSMSLDHHPGFDCGGALWFHNLTECPSGVLGSIFPVLIAGLHYGNVQLSFQRSSVQKVTGLLGLLAKYYKSYLNFLALPLFFLGHYLPQGSLVYWVTNSSFTFIQQLYFKHAKLGRQDDHSVAAAADSKAIGTPESTYLASRTKWDEVPIEDLSPKELLALSVQLISRGHKERAIALLHLALEKDPDYVRALVLLGQTHMQQGLHAEAIEHFEHAITKLFLSGHPTKDEDVDLLILASQWAGSSYIRQGKTAEGILHLERVANLKEPDDPKSKAHYFDGLLFLASALEREGRRAEAVKYLRLVVAYNTDYKHLLEEIENDEDSDLVSSKRGDS